MRPDHPLTVPEDPPLNTSPKLLAAVREFLESLSARGLADLPPLAGVEPIVVARWLYRGWLDGIDGWKPLVHLRPAMCRDAEALSDALLLARGGWLFVDVGWESWDVPGLRPRAESLGARRSATVSWLAEECRQRGVWLLRAGHGDPVPVRPEVATRLLRLDDFHLVEVDPSLVELRRGMLSHCRSCSNIHLAGEPGTGRRSLARWAHLRLDDRPLTEYRLSTVYRPGPGRWTMFEEVGELAPDALYHLRRRLEVGEDAPPTNEADLGVRRPNTPAFEAIFGSSASLARVLTRAARFAPRSISVLILGESGVGKELLARAIHEASGRRGLYRVVDLSTLNEQLIESELFGHKKGSYTGADSDRLGAFRKADGGTLFLDEIGNLSPRTQAKLLRVLQEKTVQPVGADRVVPVDVRVVAATNANLDAMVARGEFRADLLQRINAATLRLPSLRERLVDIVPLAARFVAAARGIELSELPQGWLSDEARTVLERHRWSGNVRELENLMRQANAESEDGVILEEHLGLLAPHNRRDVPLITTSSDDDGKGWSLDRDAVQRLTAVTFRLGGLRDREPVAIRSAVLGLLDGRPIRIDALSALEKRPWWGNNHELATELAAIRTNIRGTVDRAALQQTLPHLLDAVGQQPIRVLLDPVVDGTGRVSGLQESYYSNALLVGRLARARDLETLATRADAGPRDRERWEYLRRAVGGGSIRCLRLEHLTRISRAHVLITRSDDGLEVHALPHAAGAVTVRRLNGSDTARTVEVGSSLQGGQAVEVRIDTPRGNRPVVRLFAFAGSVAFEESALEAARLVGGDVGPYKTMVETSMSKKRPTWTSGMWTLEPFERRSLNDIILRYPGGDFKAHLEAELGPRSIEPEFARLAGYILRNRPTLYCTRLYTHKTNQALRQELWSAIQGTPDPTGRLQSLPTAIRRCLEEYR